MKNQYFTRASVITLIAMVGLLGSLTACGGGGHNNAVVASGETTTTVAGATTSTTVANTNYTITSLVSDGGVPAAHTDANLQNGWGLAFNPNGFAWVADNGTSKSTLYDGNGVPQSLVVSIPAGQAGPANPTGIVFNNTQDFTVTQGGVPAASAFIFSGEGGTISGWAPAVNPTVAVVAYDGGSLHKRYKGLARSSYLNTNYLYATDFHNKAIDVFNPGFQLTALPGNFTDPNLPAGYAPYGIQAIGTQLYVSYAVQDAQALDDVAGSGLGIVDVFDTSGAFVKRLITGGALNSPWGMTMAPANFGQFSNMLLVGNFGDGTINVFDPTSGALMGSLANAAGTKVVIDGLWAIAFGNGLNSQASNALFFTAGPVNETHGQYGRIDTAPPTSSIDCSSNPALCVY